MKSFLTRLISGIVLVAILIGVTIPGGWVIDIAFLAVSLIGYYELMRVLGLEKTPFFAVGIVVSVCFYIRLIHGGGAFSLEYDPVYALAFLGISCAIMVFKYPRYEMGDIARSFFAFVYVPYLLSFIVRSRLLESGIYLVWLIFLTAWGCDTLAYCSGVLLGKHKLCPLLSPNKSVEGAVGGVIGAGLLGAIYGYVLYRWFDMSEIYIAGFAAICAVGAVISQIGDLTASAIKREYEIKDYGHLIPGHGGIMDRFDSIIVTSPIIFVLYEYLIKSFM
ncbi:MAG: phosphatidate cytidylyltransferase [Eubacterium sp.]|nr:phosphatidate cytidylyltransferase [Eubacterium sp.]